MHVWLASLLVLTGCEERDRLTFPSNEPGRRSGSGHSHRQPVGGHDADRGRPLRAQRTVARRDRRSTRSISTSRAASVSFSPLSGGRPGYGALRAADLDLGNQRADHHRDGARGGPARQPGRQSRHPPAHHRVGAASTSGGPGVPEPGRPRVRASRRRVSRSSAPTRRARPTSSRRSTTRCCSAPSGARPIRRCSASRTPASGWRPSVEGGPVGTLAATYHAAGRRKRISLDGEEPARLADAVGRWLAVAFLPADVGLASGPAARAAAVSGSAPLARRPPLPPEPRPLPRGALAAEQRAAPGSPGAWPRPSTLRWPPPGAELVAARERWVVGAARAVQRRARLLGECGAVALRYCGDPALADPAAWRPALEAARGADRSAGDDDGRAASGRPRTRGRRASAFGITARPASCAAPRWRSS